MKFLVNQNDFDTAGLQYFEPVLQAFQTRGHIITDTPGQVHFVLNLTNVDHPKIFRRESKSIFVITFVVLNKPVTDLKKTCYQTLIRSLSNMVVCINLVEKEPRIYFTTPEAGFYDTAFIADTVCERILPVAGSHFAMDNTLIADLPPAYRNHTPVVDMIVKYGRELDHLGVLPTPFPLKDVLSDADIAQLYNLFEVKGISYGNLSAREHIPEFADDQTFWMTGRGVDKANLSTIGSDVFLVRGFDEQTLFLRLSVPPDYNPKGRVSVDAIEHALIYQTFPGVGAIIHIHAWQYGIPCTRQNYPCGTIELAREVVELLRMTPNPNQSVIGLKNHGLTITGHDFEDIFSRIRGKLHTQVAMYS